MRRWGRDECVCEGARNGASWDGGEGRGDRAGTGGLEGREGKGMERKK